MVDILGLYHDARRLRLVERLPMVYPLSAVARVYRRLLAGELVSACGHPDGAL